MNSSTVINMLSLFLLLSILVVLVRIGRAYLDGRLLRDDRLNVSCVRRVSSSARSGVRRAEDVFVI